MDSRITEAGVHARMAELRAHAIYGWARAVGSEERYRTRGADPEADPVADALIGLESDLSYLEELPADRVAPSQRALDETGERLKRLLGSLPGRRS